MFSTYAEIFEKRAGEYHHAMKASPNARDNEFLAVLEPIRDAPSGIVCDMPSGGGYLADYLWAGMTYVAIDPATDFIVELPKPLRRIEAEIANVPLPDGSVDFVVSLAGLHHETSLPRVFGEMRRLLRSGGRAVLADVAADTPPARFLNGFVAENCPLGHDGRFLDDQTAAALEAAGFSVADDRLIDVPWVFDDVEEVGEFGRHLFGMTTLNPAETVQAMEREIGFDFKGGRPQLRWILRRIVADAR
ncbi:class I SAM-dependent methyltransferase [Sphingomonas sp.]|uniref:class I SAM-dependent methyltransferase n=1 Tax=Sphingomonas sp. TaxID=28214 RepID=UPI0025CD9401|nr:class I SAM-dependent methyltransferase [Sphingomonas sp.]